MYYLIESRIVYRYYIEAKNKNDAQERINNCTYEFESKDSTYYRQDDEIVGETNKYEKDMILLQPKIYY